MTASSSLIANRERDARTFWGLEGDKGDRHFLFFGIEEGCIKKL